VAELKQTELAQLSVSSLFRPLVNNRQAINRFSARNYYHLAETLGSKVAMGFSFSSNIFVCTLAILNKISLENVNYPRLLVSSEVPF